jgi:hypothetical protein
VSDFHQLQVAVFVAMPHLWGDDGVFDSTGRWDHKGWDGPSAGMPEGEGDVVSLESGQSLLCDMDEITPLIRSLVTNGEDLCEYGEELPTDWEDKMRVLVDKLVYAIRLIGMEPK